FQMALHHDKDFLATKAAYHLGLSGPAFTVQAACASSLVAVHVAAGLLRQGDAEVMLAGGVLVDTLLSGGYRYRPQHIFS
ncbi:beta-ketoacyl synthase N-terminal-like domain-containing protein, partial [Stenotrophomonas maltophilia]